MLEERTYTAGPVPLSYLEGPAGGPAMVLLHGTTGSKESFASLILHLTPWWHIYALDARGHGMSGRDAGRYQLQDFIGDVVAFLRALDCPVVLVGFSLGAITAIGVAAEYPEGVRAVVLLDPPIVLRHAGIAALDGVRAYFAWVLQALTTATAHEELAVALRAREPQGDEQDVQRVARRLAAIDPDVLRVILEDRLVGEYDLGGALGRVRAPLQLQYGEWQAGSVLRDDDVAFVRSSLPAADLALIPNGSHSFFQEQEALTLAHLQRFLETLAL